MKAFADLYAALDETTRTKAKIQAMKRFFAAVPPADTAWAVYFLSGRKPKQVIPSRKLSAWALEECSRPAPAEAPAGRWGTVIPEWLFEESYHAVGDLAETIALLLPAP